MSELAGIGTRTFDLSRLCCEQAVEISDQPRKLVRVSPFEAICATLTQLVQLLAQCLERSQTGADLHPGRGEEHPKYEQRERHHVCKIATGLVDDPGARRRPPTGEDARRWLQ
jgi:predicted component of type VI protein secretion system